MPCLRRDIKILGSSVDGVTANANASFRPSMDPTTICNILDDIENDV